MKELKAQNDEPQELTPAPRIDVENSASKNELVDILDLYWADRTPAHLRTDEEDDVIQGWLAAYNEDWEFNKDVELFALDYPYQPNCETEDYTPYEPLANDATVYSCGTSLGIGPTVSVYNGLSHNVFTEDLSENCNNCIWGYRRTYGSNHEAYIGTNFVNDDLDENLINNCGNFAWDWTQRHSLYMMFPHPFSTEDVEIVIQEAHIYVTAKETSANDTFDAIIRGFAEKNSEFPLIFDGGNLRTYTNVEWTLGQWTADQEYESPDIACVLQETLDKIGTVGGYIPVVIEPDLAFNTEFMRVAYGNNSLDGTKRIRLDLQYIAIYNETTVGGGGAVVGGAASVSQDPECDKIKVSWASFTTPTSPAVVIDEEMSGGVVVSGTAEQYRYNNPETTGGAEAGGSASPTVIYNVTPTGGVDVGGAATDTQINSEQFNGGVVVNGSGVQTFSDIEEMDGGVDVGGSTDPTVTYNITPEGGAAVGGTATDTVESTYAFAGGVDVGGETDPTVAYNVTPEGGADVGGTATDTQIHSEQFNGGAVVNGSGVQTFSDIETMDGGVDVGGSATDTVIYATDITGGATCSGESNNTQFSDDVATGGAVASGVLTVSLSHNLNGSGGAKSSGLSLTYVYYYPPVAGGATVGGSFRISGGAQTVTPMADISNSGWMPEPLYENVDEASPDDNDFIYSPPVDGNTCELLLEPMLPPRTTEGHVLSYRYAKDCNVAGTTLQVEFVNGTTVVATWSHLVENDDWVEATQTLTNEEAELIYDYADLRIRFTLLT